MKIAIAADHAGFTFKESLKEYLASEGHELIDCGPSSEERCDYPDYGSKVAQLINTGKAKWGMLICGSGIGMCMVANRFKKVRAVVVRDETDARLSREHNDANVACFGARVSQLEDVKKLADIFLSADFGGGRHSARVEKIDKEV